MAKRQLVDKAYSILAYLTDRDDILQKKLAQMNEQHRTSDIPLIGSTEYVECETEIDVISDFRQQINELIDIALKGDGNG